MSLTEQLCVFALASAVAVPAMLTYRDAKDMASSQVAMVAAYQSQMQSQPRLPHCKPAGQEVVAGPCQPLQSGLQAPSQTQVAPANGSVPPLVSSRYPLTVVR